MIGIGSVRQELFTRVLEKKCIAVRLSLKAQQNLDYYYWYMNVGVNFYSPIIPQGGHLDIQETIQQASELIRAEKRADAYLILSQLTQQEPDSEDAWLWLAACTEQALEKKCYFEEALRINPNNQRTRKTLEKLTAVMPPSMSPPDLVSESLRSQAEADEKASSTVGFVSEAFEFEATSNSLPPQNTDSDLATEAFQYSSIVVPNSQASTTQSEALTAASTPTRLEPINWWQALPPDWQAAVNAHRPEQHIYLGLSHKAFEHPLDIQARAALEKVPLLPLLTKKLSETLMERIIRIQQVSSNLRVNAQQYPSLYKKYLKMARTLDIQRLPELYIETSPVINAYAMGQENFFIVITTAMVDHMNELELLGVIGHELGHVKCEHMLYVNMANLLKMFGANVLEHFLPGVGALASIGVQLALLEWYRKAEFSCDRAALLAVQDGEVVANMLAKLGGYSKHLEDTFDIKEVKRQAEEYEEIGADSLMEKMLKLYVLLNQSHPYPVVRVAELAKWQSSEAYQLILNGQYNQLPQGNSMSRFSANIENGAVLVCLNCQFICSPLAIECPACHTNLETGALVCASCRRPVSLNWEVCPDCENKLKEDSKNAREKLTPIVSEGVAKAKQASAAASSWLRNKFPGSK